MDLVHFREVKMNTGLCGGKLRTGVGKHYDRVANPDLGVADDAVRFGESADFPRAECLAEEIEHPRRTRHDEIRRDTAVAVRNRFRTHDDECAAPMSRGQRIFSAGLANRRGLERPQEPGLAPKLIALQNNRRKLRTQRPRAASFFAAHVVHPMNLPLFGLWIFCGIAAVLAEVPPQTHEFTGPNGQKFKAGIVGLEKGTVTLRSFDGKLTRTPFDSMNEADQQVVREWHMVRATRIEAVFTKRKAESQTTGEAVRNTSTTQSRGAGAKTIQESSQSRSRDEAWCYDITLTNRSAFDIGPLNVEYRQFAEQVSTTRGSGGKNKSEEIRETKGTLPVEWIPPLRSVTVRTEPITLQFAKSMNKTTARETGDSDSTIHEDRGQLDSVWIRVRNARGALLFETKSAGNIARRSKWE